MNNICETTDRTLFHYTGEEQESITVTLDTIGEVMIQPNKENSNVPHGPEATNMTLAEMLKKEYALKRVFSPSVADAHMRGDIHLHNLGMIDRVYCGGNNLDYVKKFGLNLPNALSIAKPAKHPEVLIEQMIKFSAALQGNFSGAVGWDAVNLFMAPYLVGIEQKRMKQLAQILIYEFAQQAVARGGQSIFSDLNLYWEVPCHFANVPAIGPGGVYTGKNYGEYVDESKAFLNALVDVYAEGDGMGRPFMFPKPNLHITDRFFKEEGHEDFLLKAADLSSKMGNTYYVFERGDTATVAQCCRLRTSLTSQDYKEASEPWRMRFNAMQNVTINMPRIAYRANHNDADLFQMLTDAIELSATAHIEKRDFTVGLLDMGTKGPLSMLAMTLDGEPYLRQSKTSFLTGVLGLNELVQHHTGYELHECNDAVKFGLKVISHMNNECKRLSEKYGIYIKLEQTPAETTAYRFAHLDMKDYHEHAAKVLKGNFENNGIYYTNSSYLNVGANVDFITRIKKEGLFHPLIEAGSLTHVWLGEKRPPAESIAQVVKKTFGYTQNAQIAFSPEFTTCLVCGHTDRGLNKACNKCGEEEKLEYITRVTGYFSKVSGWNKGKRAELLDRKRSEVGT